VRERPIYVRFALSSLYLLPADDTHYILKRRVPLFPEERVDRIVVETTPPCLEFGRLLRRLPSRIDGDCHLGLKRLCVSTSRSVVSELAKPSIVLAFIN